MKDKTTRAKASYYVPTDTIGSLIGRAIVSIMPVANLWAAMFDLAPRIFSKTFQFIERVFNVPLVPDSEAAKAARKGTGPA